MSRSIGDLTNEFWGVWKEIDIVGQAFVTNISSGLLVMAMEILLVVLFLGALLKYLENRKWNKTRQLLASLLIERTASMVRHTRRTIEVIPGEGRRIVLNGEIELHLRRLRTSLTNYNEHIVVYSPSLYPALSEGLSKITSQIPVIEEVVISLQHYLSSIKTKDNVYDEKKKDKGWVDGENFKLNQKERHMELAEGVLLSDENFFAVSLIELFRRTIEIAKLVEEYADTYEASSGIHKKERWQGFVKGDPIDSSVSKKVEVGIKRMGLKELYEQMKTHGVYLVLCLPDYYGTSPDQNGY